MRLSHVTRCLLLFVLVLALYHAMLRAGLITIDDPHIVAKYGINSTATLYSVFLPGDSFYFRPIVEFSYFLDGRLWGMEPSFLHLENILIHALNTLLVYWLAAEVVVKWKGSTLTPFVAAVLFAVHPVNSEPVAWFSGRTDIIAALFVLTGSCLALRWQNSGSKHRGVLLLSFIAGGCGLFAKETAVMYFPALFLLLYPASFNYESINVIQVRRSLYLVLFATVLIAVLFIFFKQRIILPAGAVKLTGNILDEFPTMAPTFLKSLGFYVKKLFIPLPLNFATVTISSIYAVFGAVVCLLAPFLFRQGGAGRLILAALLFMAPALLVAVGHITWTPVAERYLYISSAFFVVGVSLRLMTWTERLQSQNMVAALVCLISVFFAAATYSRTLDWQSGQALIRDSVQKSPDFGDLRNELAVLLMREGKIHEGREELRQALILKHNPHVTFLVHMNDLAFKTYGKKPSEALVILNQQIPDRSKASNEELSMLHGVLENCLTQAGVIDERYRLAREIIIVNDILYNRNSNAYYLYRNGQLSLLVANNTDAAGYFARAYASAPNDASFKAAAGRLANRLGGAGATR